MPVKINENILVDSRIYEVTYSNHTPEWCEENNCWNADVSSVLIEVECELEKSLKLWAETYAVTILGSKPVPRYFGKPKFYINPNGCWESDV